jgi:hypothetical protein
MITLTLAALSLVAPTSAEAATAPPAPACFQQDTDPEYEKKIADAGNDVAKLWAVHEWCKERELRDLSKQTLQKIIAIDPNHEEARKALGHRLYDGKWFESYSALSKYRKEEEARMAEKGLVRFNDGWAAAAEVPYLRMGWVKDDGGVWVHPSVIDQRKQEADLKSKGYVQQGLTWISPEEQKEAAVLAKPAEGKWKCGEEWKPLEEANTYHAQLLQWWEQPGEAFIVLTTLPRASQGANYPLEWAGFWADKCQPDLQRLVGIVPHEKPSVLVLDSLEQYNRLAQGDPNAGIPPSEVSGASSVHYAHFADALLDTRMQPPLWRGMGVCYWDYDDPKVGPWGPYAVRHAAGLSYMAAVDPSWDTVSQAVANPSNMQLGSFWTEKKLPRWMHYGAASYCERFMQDPHAKDGDPWVFRAFALQQLRSAGPLDPLDTIYTVALDPNDADGSQRHIHEAGLLVSFILDGNCAPVSAAHDALKKAFASGGSTAEAVQGLQKALADNIEALNKFAGY